MARDLQEARDFLAMDPEMRRWCETYMDMISQCEDICPHYLKCKGLDIQNLPMVPKFEPMWNKIVEAANA